MKLIAVRDVDYTKVWGNDSSKHKVTGIAYFITWWYEDIVEIKFRTNGDIAQTHKSFYLNTFGEAHWLGDYAYVKVPKSLKPRSSEMKALLETLLWMSRYPDGSKTFWVDPKYEDKLDKYLTFFADEKEAAPKTGAYR